MSEPMMRAFVAASSRRVWPGFCFAPAVMTTTSDPAVTEMSLPPLIFVAPTNFAPWARSRTSARVFSSARSYRAMWRATPRIIAACATLGPTAPDPTMVSVLTVLPPRRYVPV